MTMTMKAIFGLLLFILLGCQQPGGGISPIGVIPDIPRKPHIITSDPVEFICYIDLDKHNPLNAKDYYLQPGGTGPHIMVFDYVVLGHAYLTRDSQGYVHLGMTPALQHILDNHRTYLKPLGEKGIKILIEVRSGNYTPGEEGIGLGLGTMDVAAMQELIAEFKHLITRYGIDGYELNDAGGGYKAYPPHTRNLKRFQRDEPLYPDSIFQDENENFFSEPEIEAILWREGGSNLSNLLFLVFEAMKEVHNISADYGNPDSNDSQTVRIRRNLLVRDSGHGSSLVSQIRENQIFVDAYTDSTGDVAENINYYIRSVPNDNSEAHPYFHNENTKQNDGLYMDRKYAPLNIDLTSRLSGSDATAIANWFRGTSRYGAMYFSNLPSVAETGSETEINSYINRYTQAVFGWATRMYDGGGNNIKTW